MRRRKVALCGAVPPPLSWRMLAGTDLLSPVLRIYLQMRVKMDMMREDKLSGTEAGRLTAAPMAGVADQWPLRGGLQHL